MFVAVVVVVVVVVVVCCGFFFVLVNFFLLYLFCTISPDLSLGYRVPRDSLGVVHDSSKTCLIRGRVCWFDDKRGRGGGGGGRVRFLYFR